MRALQRLSMRIWRQHLGSPRFINPDVEKIIIDSKRLFKKPKSTRRRFPSLLDRLELYKLKSPLFESFGIESEIEKLMRPKAWLKVEPT